MVIRVSWWQYDGKDTGSGRAHRTVSRQTTLSCDFDTHTDYGLELAPLVYPTLWKHHIQRHQRNPSSFPESGAIPEPNTRLFDRQDTQITTLPVALR